MRKAALVGWILMAGAAFAQQFPLANVVITSDYGPRNVRNSFFHRGVDFRAADGTTVFSVASGTVAAKSFFVSAPIYHTRVTHGGGLSSRYLHIFCDEVAQCPSTTIAPFVMVGDAVAGGQAICTSDSTGTTQPHLHLDMSNAAGRINPISFLPFANPGPPSVDITAPADDPAGNMPLSGRVEVRATLDTVANGLDLDRVEFFIDSQLPSERIAEFTYVPQSANMRPFSGGADGVRPLGGNPGMDEFVVFWNSAERLSGGGGLRFPDGPHDIIVCGEDVDGQRSCESITVVTKNTRRVGFVIDDTGSMAGEIAAAKAGAVSFVNTVSSDPQTFAEYSLWSFKDSVSFRGTTSDPATAISLINALAASGGGDCPEASGAALAATLPVLMDDAEVLLFTDANPREGAAALASIVSSLQAQNISVSSFVFGSCTSAPESAAATTSLTGTAFEIFKQISEQTGGLFFPIVSSQVPAALDIVTAQVLRDGNALVVEGTLGADPSVFETPLDISVGRATFILQFDGSASLNLFRPDGSPVDPSDPDVVLASTPGLVSLSVEAPAPGLWTAALLGSGDFALTGAVRTTLTAAVEADFTPFAGETVPIRVSLEGTATDVSGVILNTDGSEVATVDLFDDGAHDDGMAGDRVFGGMAVFPTVGEFVFGVRGSTGTYLVGIPEPEPEPEGEELGGEGEDPFDEADDPFQRIEARTFVVEVPPDSDGDGVTDDIDECPDSNLSETVVIDGCDSGVANLVDAVGCTILDEVDACAASAENHGGFVSCVAHLTNELKASGAITGAEKGAIQSCAAGSSLP